VSAPGDLREPDQKVTAPETGSDLADREKLRFERPVSGLDRRLARLPVGHPSAVGYPDVRPRADDGPDSRRPERVRPLTDAEHAEHIAEVEEKLDEARKAGLATNIRHTIDPGNELWSNDRELIHDEIIEKFYAKSAHVPSEGRAILAGGLAGAGKTTVLAEHAGVDLSCYAIINPDVIKEELARRGLIPHVDGLSPMEASVLVHEESSHIARRLATRAEADRKNVIWDITMSRGDTTEERINELHAAGYSRIDAIFVDIPIGVSLRRVDARHRESHDNYRAGDGMGGRYIAPRLILDRADADWGSQNRRNFEQIKDRFDGWSVYDNSVDGRRPELVERSWTGTQSDERTG
jgi:predicted kinase